MKKYFLLILLLVAGLALVSCDKSKDQNNPADPQGSAQTDPQTNPQDSLNPSPFVYLSYAELEPLLMISLSKAEENLAKMGYKGGFQSYTYYEDGKEYKEDRYLYTSEDKRDSVILFPNSEGMIEEISYNASKGVIPSEAKGWLTHIPEKIPVPQRISEVISYTEVPFLLMREWVKDEIFCQTYSDYLDVINNQLASGMFIDAWWGSGPVPTTAPSGYYGGVYMRYKYINNEDWANLYIGFYYHEKEDYPEPIMPGDE